MGQNWHKSQFLSRMHTDIAEYGEEGMRCNKAGCRAWNKFGSTKCRKCGTVFTGIQRTEAQLAKIHAVDVQRHDGPILLPNGLSYADAANVLAQKAEYDEESVVLGEKVPVFIWDGALALQTAIVEIFGIAMQKATMSMFGPEPPRLITVKCGVNEFCEVPWGKFSLPGIKGSIETGFGRDNEGRMEFTMVAEVQRKFEPIIKRLFARTREIASKQSIYRAKMFKVRFRSNDAKLNWLQIPEIDFFVPGNNPPIFTKVLERAIETNILSPIRYSAVCRANNIPLKRGILLAGAYGTGKTLTAAMIARDCPPNSWTFIYVENVEELSHALKFSQMFSPAVVFCEDVDRLVGQERTDDANNLLNVLDGVNTKNTEIIVVLTSNHADQINEALRRKGRIDVTLEVVAPDAEAVQRLIRHYAGSLVSADEDLSPVGKLLDGSIPALIREVVERAKLEAITRSGGTSLRMTGDDLLACAEVLLKEESLFRNNNASVEASMRRKITSRVEELIGI